MPDTAADLIDSAAAGQAWRPLRMLEIGRRRSLCRYVAGDLRAGRHIVAANGVRRRELHRDEVVHWLDGVAAAHTKPRIFDDVGPVPELLTPAQTGEMLGLKLDGVNYHTHKSSARRERLYPIYLLGPGGWSRAYFADQIAGRTGDAEAATRWLAIRELLLPPIQAITDLGDWRGPAPSPDPLPLPADGKLRPGRYIKALLIGHGEGWFEYVHGDPAGPGRYTVKVYDGRRRVEVILPGAAVLPWVLGHADVHGFPELVAYREGLG